VNVFHIGDPVLVVGGISPNHRRLVGHATTVTSELIEAKHVRTGKWWNVHMVEESQRIFAGARLCYRPQDLMPLGGSKELQKEETVRTLEVALAQYGFNKALQEALIER